MKIILSLDCSYYKNALATLFLNVSSIEFYSNFNQFYIYPFAFMLVLLILKIYFSGDYNDSMYLEFYWKLSFATH